MHNLQALKIGAKDAIGVPALGLGLSMFAFGAFLKSVGFNAMQSFSSTFFAFALPGQFVMVETLIAGGTILNIFLAVLLTNARLFPMTVNLMPIIREPSKPNWKYYFICHFIAVTAWFNMLDKHIKIEKKNKYSYFLGLGGFLWLNSVFFTVLGYYCSFFVTKEILLGMVFFNPMYFLVMTIGALVKKDLILSVLLAAFLSPFIYIYIPDWGVLVSGIIAGTVGFFTFKKKAVYDS